MATIATLCSGGECVGIGAQMAGLKHLYGIEYKADIAQVAITNGFNVLVRDITQCNPLDYERTDVLHASPPCPNFSVAKNKGKETTEDISIARAVCNFISALHPDIFTLENVYGYRKSQSWLLIAKTLQDNGYGVAYWHLNAANYGVPQTRKRMVVVAMSDGITPQRPIETHAPRDKIAPMFDNRQPWIGWYQVIEDLIPTLPDSEFAQWQLNKIPDELLRSFAIDCKNSRNWRNGELVNEPVTIKNPDDPLWALQAEPNTNHVRAFIVPGGNSSSFSLRAEDEPTRTIGDTERTGNAPRAFLVDSKQGSTEYGAKCRELDYPSMTIATDHPPRAYIGRVVQMTPRCLARFQSIPDTYILPDSNALACRVIGNGVPPLLYKAVIESALSSTNLLVK